MAEKKLYLVERCKISSDNEKLEQLKKYRKNEAELIQQAQQFSETWKWSNFGVFLSIYFRVNENIKLEEIGFFGPQSKDEGKYFVHVELFKGKGTKIPFCSDLRIAKTRVFANCKKNEIFFVQLVNEDDYNSKGYFIQKKTWHLLQFMLDKGPETKRADKCLDHVSIETKKAGLVTFDFLVEGPAQLPFFKFSIP